MKKLRFLLSLTTKDNDFQLEQAASAQQTARQLGADLEILYADNDSITQSTQLLKVIQSAPESLPSAIVFEPVGGTAFPQVARAATAAGIGWAVLNREAEYIPELRKASRVPVFSLSSDHREIGKIQGQQFCALLPRGGSSLLPGAFGEFGCEGPRHRHADGSAIGYSSDRAPRTMDGRERVQEHDLLVEIEYCA